MALDRVVLITGLSGAGKSQAMKSFEDLGFACVDHLPPVMLASMCDLAEQAASRQLAIAPDVHTGGVYGDAAALIDALKQAQPNLELLFLEATDAVLVRRYSETRRRHPFGDQHNVSGAIAVERAALAPLRRRADLILDTSTLSYTGLKAKILSTYQPSNPEQALAVSVIAFGFKHGLPLDADLVFDVRFLENPHYQPELQALTGNDPPVAAFIEALPETKPFLDQLEGMLSFLLPKFAREGKSHLTIAVGCTGGRHRSVYVAQHLAAFLRHTSKLPISFTARDLSDREH